MAFRKQCDKGKLDRFRLSAYHALYRRLQFSDLRARVELCNNGLGGGSGIVGDPVSHPCFRLHFDGTHRPNPRAAGLQLLFY